MKKIYLLLLSFIICIFSIAAISAAENTVNDGVISVDHNQQHIETDIQYDDVSASNENVELKEENNNDKQEGSVTDETTTDNDVELSFTDLNSTIDDNSNTTDYLSYNCKYNNVSNCYKVKNFTIHLINCSSKDCGAICDDGVINCMSTNSPVANDGGVYLVNLSQFTVNNITVPFCGIIYLGDTEDFPPFIKNRFVGTFINSSKYCGPINSNTDYLSYNCKYNNASDCYKVKNFTIHLINCSSKDYGAICDDGVINCMSTNSPVANDGGVYLVNLSQFTVNNITVPFCGIIYLGDTEDFPFLQDRPYIGTIIYQGNMTNSPVDYHIPINDLLKEHHY